MDRRKFIQTGIAGVAGLSLVRTGLANIQMTVLRIYRSTG